jgi:hypothetical protein
MREKMEIQKNPWERRLTHEQFNLPQGCTDLSEESSIRVLWSDRSSHQHVVARKDEMWAVSQTLAHRE